MQVLLACYAEYMVMPVVAYGKIKPLRQAKGLNQADIAAELGISRPTYVLIEQGAKEPTITQLYTLARLLGTEPDNLCANLPSAMPHIADYATLKELIATCATHGATHGTITKTKLAILAYLADFAWYNSHFRSITGADYRCTARGPVADDYFRAIDELYEGQVIALEPSGTSMLIRPLEQLPARLLKNGELALVRNICNKWQLKSTEELIRFATQQEPCKAVKMGDIIPYEAALHLAPDSLY